MNKKQTVGIKCAGQTCDGNAYCSSVCTCLPGFFGNSTQCYPNARTIEVAPYEPVVRYLFYGNNLDSSGNGNSANIGSNSIYSNFYQKNDTSNMALFINSSVPISSSSSFQLSNQFTVQVIFNVQRLQAFTLLSLMPSSASPTSFGDSLIYLTVNRRGRLQVLEGYHVLRTMPHILKVGITYNLVITSRDNQLVGWIDDERVFTAVFKPSYFGSYNIFFGYDFVGYLDELAVFSEPVPANRVSDFDGLLSCDLSCPSGVCKNYINGPSCT